MILFLGNCTQAQNSSNDSELDDKVKDFLDSRRSSGSQAYLEYVQSLDNYNTTVDDSGGGVAISYKK